ncbi:MAG: hypothetical protein U0271_19565 [Polyangiaceae bacterium]
MTRRRRTTGLRSSLLTVIVAVAALAGCGPSEPAGGSAKPSSSQAKSASSGRGTGAGTGRATSAVPSASAASSADEGRGKMVHCPSAVEGAKTEITDTPRGVDLTITATDPAKVTEIRNRVKVAVEKSQADPTGGAHTGKGGGGGSMGRCPVVLGGTEVTAADVEGGSKISVASKDTAEVDWLRREAKERLAALEDPDSAASGEGKMANCPSAVSGAKTAVKEDAGAIVVTITAKDKAAVDDIRARASKTATMKHGAGKAHGGQGGGAARGRCPSVLEGTTATVKDVDGGAEIRLKPDKAEELKKLSSEASDRAKRFD